MDTSNSAKISLTDLEESRMKSKSARSVKHSLSQAMAEALYQPYTQTQPKPLANRVKDAGKDFLRHNQTCQWIQFIQEQPPQEEVKKEYQQTKMSRDLEECSVIKIKESDTPADSEIGVPLALSLTNSTSTIEEQLRNVHKQQEALMEQQHLLEEQMEQQKKNLKLATIQEIQPKSISPDIADIKSLSSGTFSRLNLTNVNGPPSRFRRRLKGCIAQSYAERDEGSIGSLLYNNQDYPNERKSCLSNSTCTNCSRPSFDGRQYALSQESGSNISQLLMQLPYCSSLDMMKNRCESSATITETATTDHTVVARSGTHVDI